VRLFSLLGYLLFLRRSAGTLSSGPKVIPPFSKHLLCMTYASESRILPQFFFESVTLQGKSPFSPPYPLLMLVLFSLNHLPLFRKAEVADVFPRNSPLGRPEPLSIFLTSVHIPFLRVLRHTVYSRPKPPSARIISLLSLFFVLEISDGVSLVFLFVTLAPILGNAFFTCIFTHTKKKFFYFSFCHPSLRVKVIIPCHYSSLL